MACTARRYRRCLPRSLCSRLGIAVRREVDDLFQQAVPLGNTVPRDELKDLVPDAELSLPAFNVVTGSYDPRSLKSTLLEFKTMRYGVKYTTVPRATAVDRFERSLLDDIQRGLAARDAAWHNTEPGQKGPLRDILDMSEYTGMVFGTVGEVSKGVHRTVRGIACLAADRGALSSRGTRCITRAHQEALLARDFLGVMSLVAARERARCLIRRRRFVRHPVAAQQVSGSPSHAHVRARVARTLNRARITHPSRLMRDAGRF